MISLPTPVEKSMGARATIATPSVKSYALVRQGKLERLHLPNRARTRAMLPKVEIVDLRRVGPGPAGDRLLSLPLHRALERTPERVAGVRGAPEFQQQIPARGVVQSVVRQPRGARERIQLRKSGGGTGGIGAGDGGVQAHHHGGLELEQRVVIA